MKDEISFKDMLECEEEEHLNYDEDWFLKIIRLDNGYILIGSGGMREVVEDNERDELESHYNLLWKVMDHFNFGGSKHDPERIRIIRKKKED